MVTKYKIWIEIQRIDIDENNEEEYTDCDFPEGVAYRDTYEEAEVLQQLIVQTFNEI